MIREKDIEAYLVKQSSSKGWSCVKFVPDYQTGMPDRLLLLPNNRCAWIELKTDKGVLSSVQKYQHKQLRKLGQSVYTVRSKDDVDNLLSVIEARVMYANEDVLSNVAY